MKKVYVVSNHPFTQNEYSKWINFEFELVTNPNDADLIIFTGGTDVNPALYGEARHYLTQAPDVARDEREAEIFANFVGKVPMAGICRGSQFLTIMNGGKLFQHINGHGCGGHDVVDLASGKVYRDTSGHHQMMYPFNLPEDRYEIIAMADKNLSDEYIGMSDISDDYIANFPDRREVEIVFYPDTQCLCIQGHPEWGYPTPYSDYCNDLVQTKLLNPVYANQ